MTLGMTQSFLDTVPLCEGPDLPQVQLLLGDPRLDDGGPRLLGGLWFLGSECARAEALPLGSGGLCGTMENGWRSRGFLHLHLVI